MKKLESDKRITIFGFEDIDSSAKRFASLIQDLIRCAEYIEKIVPNCYGYTLPLSPILILNSKNSLVVKGHAKQRRMGRGTHWSIQAKDEASIKELKKLGCRLISRASKTLVR